MEFVNEFIRKFVLVELDEILEETLGVLQQFILLSKYLCCVPVVLNLGSEFVGVSLGHRPHLEQNAHSFDGDGNPDGGQTLN